MKRNNRNIVAIDIARDTLQIQTRQNSFSVTNNQRGFACLQQRITNALDNPLVVCESTGGYERPLLAFLHAKRIDVALVNPRLIHEEEFGNRLVREFSTEELRVYTKVWGGACLLRFSHGATANTESIPVFECFMGWFEIGNFEIGVGWIHQRTSSAVIRSAAVRDYTPSSKTILYLTAPRRTRRFLN